MSQSAQSRDMYFRSSTKQHPLSEGKDRDSPILFFYITDCLLEVSKHFQVPEPGRLDTGVHI
jgi:hypothetical protein